MRPLIAGNNHPKTHGPRTIFSNQLRMLPPTATVFIARLHGVTHSEYSSRAAPSRNDSALFSTVDQEAQRPPSHTDAPPDDYDNSKACFVCWDASPDAVLLECGHSGLCVACAERLLQRERRCPLCRMGFTGVVRIVCADAAVVRTQARTSRKPIDDEREVWICTSRGRLGGDT